MERRSAIIGAVLGIVGLIVVYKAVDVAQRSRGPHTFAQAIINDANRGKAEAQFKLAQMYDAGNGVEHDAVKAVHWYKKAAKQGYAEAEYRLGVLYYEGKGISNDIKEGLKWCSQAAEHGYDKAKEKLKEWGHATKEAFSK